MNFRPAIALVAMGAVAVLCIIWLAVASWGDGIWTLVTAILICVIVGTGLAFALPALRGAMARRTAGPVRATGFEVLDDDAGRQEAGPADRSGSGAATAGPYRRKHIFQRAMPSAREDYDLLFSAVVCWRGPDLDAAAAEGAAVGAVEERARAFVAAVHPEDADAVQSRLAAAFGAETGPLPLVWEVWAEGVRIELAQADADRLDRLRDVRKRKAAREEERELERLERAYLGDDALADPGRAVVWWLSRNPDRIDEVVGNIGTLSRLSAAATGEAVPELYRDLARDERPEAAERVQDLDAVGAFGDAAEPDHDGRTADEAAFLAEMHRLVDDGDADAREEFIDRTATGMEELGRARMAALLREEFGVPDAWRASPYGGTSSPGDLFSAEARVPEPGLPDDGAVVGGDGTEVPVSPSSASGMGTPNGFARKTSDGSRPHDDGP